MVLEDLRVIVWVRPQELVQAGKIIDVILNWCAGYRPAPRCLDVANSPSSNSIALPNVVCWDRKELALIIILSLSRV